MTMEPMTHTGKLGDHDVQRIGYGAMQLAGRGVMGPPKDRDAAIAVLRRAVELGVNHIDTSQYYGPDVVNEIIREALHPYPDDLRLVTKVGARRDADGGWLPALEPAELREGVEANLKTLGVERMTMVNLRLMDEDGDDRLPEQLGELADLRNEGKLELIGISNVNRETVERALELTDIASVQNSYSIVDRTYDDVLDLCHAHGMAFVPFFPLGSAFTGGPAELAKDAAIQAVAEKTGVTTSQVALAWLLHRSPRVLLIPGTGSVAHLEENLGANAVALDADDMGRLEEVEHLGDPMSRLSH
jgi:pyridoxine 4-dehydrogenase